MPVKTRPTQADVAKIAGVSQLAGFAKRVLNQSEIVKVPEDISVVGFDDISLARFAKQIAVDPQLTSISQPISEIVDNITRLLFREARIQNEKDSRPDTEPQKIILQPSLRFAVRDSTRGLARSHALLLCGCEAGIIL
jgi:DNA-binding LacI/PurR family transcriptional regulator